MARIRMETVYNTLRAKRNNPSKNYLMVSEFIDNSISSINSLNDRDTRFFIKILIDTNEERITIEDNAGGMDMKTLEESIRMNNEKVGNNLNMFGVGMKNASFWYGQDLEIFSNDGNATYFTEVKLSNLTPPELNTPVEWEVIKKDDVIMKRGTKIIVSKLYTDRSFPKKEIEDLKQILSVKYANYLKKNINIYINYIDEDGRSYNNFLSPNSPKAQTIEKDKKEKIINDLVKIYKNKHLSYLIDIVKKTTEIINSDKELILEFDVHLKGTLAPEGKTAKLHIGILAESKNFTLYGLATYQRDRAINFAPENSISLGEKIRTNIKRVFGWIDLTEFFQPDNNKSASNYGKYKEEFDTMIKRIGEEILPLADLIFSIYSQRRKVKSGNTKGSRKDIENIILPTLNEKTIKFNMTKNGCTFNYKLKNSNYKFQVVEKSLDGPDNKSMLLHSDIVNDHEYKISFNVNNPIWKPLLSSSKEGGANKIIAKSALYKIVVILGICEISMVSPDFGTFLEENKIKKSKFLDILSLLAGTIISND